MGTIVVFIVALAGVICITSSVYLTVTYLPKAMMYIAHPSGGDDYFKALFLAGFTSLLLLAFGVAIIALSVVMAKL